MTTYIAYRHGSNAANQSMRQVAPVLVVEAESADAARDKAREIVNCYNNQYLSIKPASRCSAADRQEASHATEARELLAAGDQEAWESFVARSGN